MPQYWKFLTDDQMPTHGTGRWEINVWRSVVGRVVPCENGIHATTEAKLVDWIAPALHPIVLGGEVTICTDKVVSRSGCVGPRLAGWNAQTARLFAADCAAHVKHHAHDPRVSAAIIIARARAFELVGQNVWDAALAAAWAAAARADAADAAWAAARAAARADAGTAARAAARADARAAARDAEKAWQSHRLLAYACGGIDLDACKAQTIEALPAALKAVGL